MTEGLEWVPEGARIYVKGVLRGLSKRTGIPYKIVVRFYQGYYADLVERMVRETGSGFRHYTGSLTITELHSILVHGFASHFMSSSCRSCLAPLKNSVVRFIWNIVERQIRNGVCKIHKEKLVEVTGISEEYVDMVLREYAHFHGYRYENGVLNRAEQ